jgi:hypothetical protein
VFGGISKENERFWRGKESWEHLSPTSGAGFDMISDVNDEYLRKHSLQTDITESGMISDNKDEHL